MAVACVLRDKNAMKIMIGDGGMWIPKSEEMPIPGRSYYLHDADEYTPPMRALWEALVEIAFRSGEFSVDTIDKGSFRSWVKRRYGEGFDRLRYVSENKMIEVKTVEEIPEGVLMDFSSGNSSRILGVLKSTTRYSKRQFLRMIENTISAMIERGIDTPQFRDIINEMSRKKEEGMKKIVKESSNG